MPPRRPALPVRDTGCAGNQRNDNDPLFHCNGTVIFCGVPRSATSALFASGAASNTNALPFFDTSDAPLVTSIARSAFVTNTAKRLRGLALGTNVVSPIVNGYA